MEKQKNIQQTDVTLYAVALNSHEHGRHPKGLTLVKLNNIRAAQPYLPTKEVLQIHWAKECVRVKREEILNEKRKPEEKVFSRREPQEKVFSRREPLCIGIKSADFDAILTELRTKCRDFGPNEEAIGCVMSGYSPVCLLCRMEDVTDK